jgi:RNA polymerase sigma factor (sigma-70 family)
VLVSVVDERRTKFQQWFAPHLDAAYNFAFWLSQERADAEDVVQEAAIKAFQSINRFDGREPRAWLFAIIRNEFYSLYRSRSRVQHQDIDDVPELVSPDRTPEANVIAAADRDQVWNSLGKLPPEYREVLVLREFEGFSYREIADTSEIPIGTVMSRLARARAQLLHDLGKQRAKGESR